MTILSFDYGDSYRGVTHTKTYFDALAPQLFTEGVGYDGQSVAQYAGTSILHHTSDTGVETLDGRTPFHFEKPIAELLGIPISAVLAHAPASDHYDLWQHIPGKAEVMSLRVSADVAEPPSWSNYMQADYYGDTAGASGYSNDFAIYASAVLTWESGDGWLRSGDDVIGHTEATLRDGNHVLATIKATSELDPKLFLDIANYQTVVAGSTHNDRLEGGSFDDQLLGQAGNDRLEGLDGKDELDGGIGKDTLGGGGDDDHLDGGSGNDILDGGNQDDHLEGGAGGDQLSGNTGNDHVEGGDNKDYLLGNTGDDELEAGNGNDKLFGNRGRDTLHGDDGNDRLDGGQDADKLFGGAGKNQFVFAFRDSVDAIGDFNPGGDKIVLIKSAFAGIGKLDADAFHDGPHATDAEDRIIYWHDVLYYDADGNKDGDHGFQQVAFAKIVDGATLSHTDFLLE